MSDKTVQIIEIVLAIIAAIKGLDKLHDRHRRPPQPQITQQAPYEVERPRRLPPVEPEFPIPVTPFNPRGWQ